MAQPISAPTTNPTHPASQQSLASAEGLGSITQCSCGTLSLNVQAFSLRLDLESFARLLLMCSEAMEAVERGIKADATTLSKLIH
ncbi:MAG: hypothetical protein PW792_15040 [Acidobacteriaceae bacterium]|nr:hypothetical protein [Acidobacteriaceae bacterium]